MTTCPTEINMFTRNSCADLYQTADTDTIGREYKAIQGPCAKYGATFTCSNLLFLFLKGAKTTFSMHKQYSNEESSSFDETDMMWIKFNFFYTDWFDSAFFCLCGVQLPKQLTLHILNALLSHIPSNKRIN